MKNVKNVWEFVEKYFPNYSSSDEILRNNDLIKAIEQGEEDLTEDLKDSNSYIFEEAIKGFINESKEIEKTYYLIGGDATAEYNDNGIDGVLTEYEANELTVSLFCFIEGETRSHELADALSGWNDYVIITEEEFLKLQ